MSLNPSLTVQCTSASALEILWELEIEMENKMDDLVFWLLTLSLGLKRLLPDECCKIVDTIFKGVTPCT